MPETLDRFAARLVVASSRFARTVSLDAGEQRSLVAMRVLSNLQRLGPLRIGELARRERITQPAMTSTVNRLVDEGLAERHADPADARASVVGFTDVGREALDAFRARSGAVISPALAALDPADLAALERAAELLEQLVEEHETRPATREAS